VGTSSNSRSPNTPSWKLARATIGKADLAAEHQSRELWRAAASDVGANVVDFLSSKGVFRAAHLAQTASDPDAGIDALYEMHRAAGQRHILNSSVERALLRTLASDRTIGGFAGELLSEAADYYASRDLPSFVGTRGHIATTTESIDLKNQLRATARAACADFPVSQITHSTWKKLIETAVDRLMRGKK
jgi:hypothetical protein